ncbi:MAG: hypothetical protein ACRC5C_11680, partial [Bacilli bacterium]
MAKESVGQTLNATRERFRDDLKALLQRVVDFIEGSQLKTESEQVKKQIETIFGKAASAHYVYDWANQYVAFVHMFSKRETALASYLAKHPQDALAKQLVHLPVRLMQCVEQSDSVYVWKDLHTEERFTVSNKEGIPPWGVQFGIVLNTEHGAQVIFRHVSFAPELLSEEVLSLTESGRREQFLPLLEQTLKKSAGELEKNAIVYHHRFEAKGLEQHFEKNEHWIVDVLEGETFYHFTLETLTYTDTMFEAPVHMQSIDGSMVIREGSATFTTVDATVNEAFVTWLQETLPEVETESDAEEMMLPTHATLRHYAYTTEAKFDDRMAVVAQKATELQPTSRVAAFDGQTFEYLVANGQAEAVDAYLKQLECDYMNFTHPYSVDFNTLRQSLGLALSPFHFGFSDRTSALEVKKARPERMVEDAKMPVKDPLTKTDDVLATAFQAFVEAKVEGKAQATISKYRRVEAKVLAHDSIHALTTTSEQEAVIAWVEALFETEVTKEMSATFKRDVLSVWKQWMKELQREHKVTWTACAEARVAELLS